MSDSIPAIACVCTGSGHCPLRGRTISAREYSLCSCSADCDDSNFCTEDLCARRRVRWDNERRAQEGLSARPLPVVSNGKTCTPQPPDGPGTRLKVLIDALGLGANGSCGCNAYARKMDRWGSAGCKEREDEIVRHISQQVKGLSPAEILRAVVGAAFSLPFTINPLSPVRSLVRHAIREAAETGY